jgi:hypothetical protein
MYTVFQSAEVVEYMNDMGYNVSGISEREFYQGIGWSDDREDIDLGEKGKKDDDSFRLLKLILHFAVFFWRMYLSSGPENIEKFFGNSTFNGTLYNLDFTNVVSTSSPLSLFLSFLSLSLSYSLLGHSLLSSLLLIMPSLSFFRLSAAIRFENRPLCCFHHPQCLRRFPVPGTVQLRHHHHTGTQHHRMELMRERKEERGERERERERKRKRIERENEKEF